MSSTTELDAWFDVCQSNASGVISAVLQHLPRGGVFLDVGANVGAVTEAAILGKSAVVYAWEPVPDYAAYCGQRNPTARVYWSALGDRMDVLELWCDRTTNPGWNTFVTEKLTPQMEAMQVKVLPLDMYRELPKVDVIKIDTEGYEADVLRGAHKRILADKPVLIIELGWGVNHPRRDEVVKELEWLFANGYERVPYDFSETRDVVLCPSR